MYSFLDSFAVDSIDVKRLVTLQENVKNKTTRFASNLENTAVILVLFVSFLSPFISIAMI
jgi:hypothetical protein